MKIRYLEAAEAEFEEAIHYYNEQRTGLGFEFSDEVKTQSPAFKTTLQLGHRYRNALAAARSIDFPSTSFTKHEPIRS